MLANLYMNRFLKAWRQRGKGEQYRARLVNYADDFVILSRGHASEALVWTRWVMKRLELTLNETKTRVCDAREQSFDFLGYTYGPERYRKDGHRYLAAKPSKKAVQRLKGKIRAELRTGNQQPWPQVARRLNSILYGWSGYFGYGTRLMAYREVDNYVYERVRGFLRRRHKVPGRGIRRFPAEVVFGDLGVLRLRRRHVGPPPCAAV